MFKTLKKRIKNEKGLSLVELLAVIVIMAIIAAIAIPAIGNIINNTRDKAVLSEVQSAISSAKIAMADGSCASATVCEGDELEFTSEKVAITSVTFNKSTSTTTGGTTTTVPANIEVVATLAKAMSGERIPEAITEAGGTLSDKALTITEKELQEVLD